MVVEQVGDGVSEAAIQAAPSYVLLAVVREVAPATQRREIGVVVVPGVVIQVSGGKDDAPSAGLEKAYEIRGSARLSVVSIPVAVARAPGSVGKLQDRRHVRAAASLARSAGSFEADSLRNRTPVFWIESAQLGPDRHDPRSVGTRMMLFCNSSIATAGCESPASGGKHQQARSSPRMACKGRKSPPGMTMVAGRASVVEGRGRAAFELRPDPMGSWSSSVEGEARCDPVWI